MKKKKASGVGVRHLASASGVKASGVKASGVGIWRQASGVTGIWRRHLASRHLASKTYTRYFDKTPAATPLSITNQTSNRSFPQNEE